MQNQITNTLATMASMMDGPKEDEAWLIVVEQKEKLAYCMSIKGDEEINGEGQWYSNILQYLKDGTYQKIVDNNDQLTIRRLSTNYIICDERLYRRSYDGIHLLCVTAVKDSFFGPRGILYWQPMPHQHIIDILGKSI